MLRKLYCILRTEFENSFKINKEYTYEEMLKIAIILILGLFILQTIDFLSTWLGINILNVVVELNIFFKFLFDLDFKLALLIRLVMQLMISYLAINLAKENFTDFKLVMYVSISLNLYLLYRHVIHVYTFI